MKWNVYTSNEYITIGKVRLGKYKYDDVLEMSKKYRYVYKASRNFFSCEFDDKYSLYLLSNEDLYYLIDFLNNLRVIIIMSNKIGNIKNCKSLYNIKEKIEIL